MPQCFPGASASVHGDKATVFVADGNRAKKVVVGVKGEVLGTLYVDVELPPGAKVVTEGRSLLADGDLIAAKVEDAAPATPQASAGTKP